MSIGTGEPSVRAHVPSAAVTAVGAPAVATATITEVPPKKSGEMKTMKMSSVRSPTRGRGTRGP